MYGVFGEHGTKVSSCWGVSCCAIHYSIVLEYCVVHFFFLHICVDEKILYRYGGLTRAYIATRSNTQSKHHAAYICPYERFSTALLSSCRNFTANVRCARLFDYNYAKRVIYAGVVATVCASETRRTPDICGGACLLTCMQGEG